MPSSLPEITLAHAGSNLHQACISGMARQGKVWTGVGERGGKKGMHGGKEQGQLEGGGGGGEQRPA